MVVLRGQRHSHLIVGLAFGGQQDCKIRLQRCREWVQLLSLFPASILHFCLTDKSIMAQSTPLMLHFRQEKDLRYFSKVYGGRLLRQHIQDRLLGHQAYLLSHQSRSPDAEQSQIGANINNNITRANLHSMLQVCPLQKYLFVKKAYIFPTHKGQVEPIW